MSQKNNNNNNNNDENKENIPPTPTKEKKVTTLPKPFKKPLPAPFKTGFELYCKEKLPLKRKQSFSIPKETVKKLKIEEGAGIFQDITKAVMQTQIDNLIRRNGILENTNRQLEETNAKLLTDIEVTRDALKNSNECVGFLDTQIRELRKEKKELRQCVINEKIHKSNLYEQKRVLDEEVARLQDKYEPTLQVLYDIEGQANMLPRDNQVRNNKPLPHHNDIRKFFMDTEAKTETKTFYEDVSSSSEESETEEVVSDEY